jgi:hypothetical protein
MAQITLNSTGVASNGSLVLQSNGTTAAVTIDTSQRAAFVAGTEALPAITTTGDTNTGIFFPAADTIAFSEGGVEAMRIDSSGNVGIGTTTNPAPNKLSVVGGSVQLSGGTTSQEGIRIQRASGYASITGINHDNNAFNPIAFITSGTEAARIDTSGNVGIGTSSPTGKLHVSGFVLSGGQNYSARFSDAVNSTYSITHQSGLTNLITDTAMAFYTSNTERMRIDTSGNVGIGTTATAGQQLTIASSGSSSAANAFYVYNSTPVALFTIRNDGAIFSGTAPASPYNLTTASAANMFVDSGGVVYRSTSSLRYKENVQDYGKGLSDIARLRPVTFNTKPKDTDENSDTHTYAGFIAEEVDAAGLTEFVQYNNEGQPDALAYPNMVALLTAAIQEQQAIITALTERITALEEK